MSDHITEALTDAFRAIEDATESACDEIIELESALSYMAACVRRLPGRNLTYSELLGKWCFDPGPDGKEGYGVTIRQAILASKANGQPTPTKEGQP